MFFVQINGENIIPKDSVEKVAEVAVEKLSQLKNMSVDDLLSMAGSWMVDLVVKILIALLIYFIGRWFVRRIVRVMQRVCERREVDLSLQLFFKRVIEVVLYVGIVLTVIGVLGINTTSLVAMFASASLAVGMALSGTMQNFAGGVMIMMLRPYRIGDYVEAQGYDGVIKEVRLFNTVITTYDNKTIYIPNNMISSGIIKNYSQEPMRRVDWNITISYGDDVAVARRALLAIMQSDQRVKSDPAPTVYLTSLGDSAVNVSARGWVDTADYWSTFFDLNERIYRELPGYGINFPFPQLQVHFDADERPAPDKGADVPERPSTAASDSVKR